MATDYVDVVAGKDHSTATAGTGGTLSGTVRVLYDDTADPDQIRTAALIAIERITEIVGG